MITIIASLCRNMSALLSVGLQAFPSARKSDRFGNGLGPVVGTDVRSAVSTGNADSSPLRFPLRY